MKNRVERQMAVKKIIVTEKISSQEELLHILKKRGFELTQATLSRDLRALKVAKAYDAEAGYIYVVPEVNYTEKEDTTVSGMNYLADGFKSLQFSGSLAVLHTKPGYASSMAAVIDTAEPFEIIGTIAGDDTVLLIMREGVKKADLINSLILIMPKLATIIK